MDAAPNAYLNGQWVSASEARVSVADSGFVLGATISEQLRTFGGRIFELDRHLARLQRSLEIVGIPLPEPLESIAAAAIELVRRNRDTAQADGDLGLAILITPGPYAAFASGVIASPTLCLHTYPLPFGAWANQYVQGQALVVTDTRQIPANCWPPEIKCRSRMHYYLADREAARREPGARALLLDQDEQVTETTTANLLVWSDETGLVSPPRDLILPGISLAVTRELSAERGIPCGERQLRIADLHRGSELLVTSTPYGILPVTRLDGRPIGDGRPGKLFRLLLSAWNERAGIDLAKQAARCAGITID